MNKTKNIDIDFIGGGRPLTKEDELAISAFIRADKEKRKKRALAKATRKKKRVA